MTAAVFHFKPYNVGRWIIWGGFALILATAIRKEREKA